MFDDDHHIVENGRIRHLWPLSDVLGGTDRPLPRLSLAVNYAIGGLRPWGYHAFNLAVHILAGLLLFGIVRRTLENERLRARYERAAPWLAGAVAVIWLVHPIQTAAVTYIVQRDESMMGLFFLLTLYCGIRGFHSPHRHAWYVAAIIACALGMGTKQVMVSAPIIMLLYDRVFVAKSFKEIFWKRRRLYAGLAATWLVLAALLAILGVEQVSGFAGEREKVSAWEYAKTEPGVIVHYLRLALWPQPLVFDYRWPVAGTMISAAPWAALVLALLGGVVLAFRRHPWLGFLGAWFFLILAPTSSILPIADAAVEHRMYLPLAAVVVLAVIGGYELLGSVFCRFAVADPLRRFVWVGVAVAVVVALGFATIRRNDDYRSNLALWSDTASKRPDNYRAHYNLGIALEQQGRISEAVAHFSEGARLKPDYVPAHINLGLALVKQGRIEDAIAHYSEALRLKPNDAVAHNSLGSALAREGKLDLAIAEYSEALRFNPNYAEAQNNLGAALYRQGQIKDATARFVQALKLNPDYAEAHNNLGAALGGQGRLDEAIEHFASAVRIKPDFTEARDNLRKAQATSRPVK